MSDQLKVIIKAILDQSGSTKEIKSQLNQISKSLDLKLNIDSKSIERVTDENGQLLKSVNTTKNAYGELVQVVDKLDKKTKKYVTTTKTLENNNAELKYWKDADKLANDYYKSVESIKTKQQKSIEDSTGITQFDQRNKKSAQAYQAVWDKAYTDRLANIEKVRIGEIKTQEKLGQNYWQGNFEDSVKNLTAKNTELQKMGNYYRNLEKETTKAAKAQEQWNTIGINNKNKLATDFQTFLNENPKVVKSNVDQINTLKDAINNVDNQSSLRKARGEVSAFKSEVTSLGQQGRTVFGELINNAKKFASWFLLGGIISSTVGTIKSLVTNVVELDKAMTDIRYVIGTSREETLKLIDSYEKLAQKLGATTIEVVKSANEWLRQGKTIAETNQLIESAMIFSKIAAIDSVSATQYLTSVMKGYGISAEDALDGIVSKLSEVDMVSATSAAGLAEAMSRTSNSAKIAGVSIDKLISYLAVVGEVTQKEMSSIGESFKTIFSRMGNIKLGIYLDDDGEDLSDVEKILSSLDIKLRDSSNSFRNFGDVLDEVGSRWSSFDQVQQSAIANAFAGVRQRENFLVLMENYGTSLEYVEASMNSAGTAMEKFGFYQESIESKTNRLKQSFESLSYNTINGTVIKGFVDLGNVLIRAIDKLGLFNTVWLTLVTVGGVKGFRLFTSLSHLIVGKLIPAITGATASSLALASAMQVIAPIAIITGIIGLVKVIDHFTTSLSEQAEIVSNLTSEIQSLNSEYDTLKSKAFLTGEEQKRLQLLEKELEIKEKLLEAEKKTQAQMVLSDLTGGISVDQYGIDNTASSTKLQKTIDQLRKYKKIQDDIIKTQEKANSVEGTLADFKKLDELNGKLAKLESGFLELYNSLQPVIESGQKLSPEITNLISNLEEVLGITGDYTTAIAELTEKQELLISVSNKVNNSQALTKQEVDQLKELYPELESAIYQTADGWMVEKDALDLVTTGVNDLKVAYTDAQNQMEVILESSVAKRLGILSSELSAISSVADAYALFAGKGGGAGLTEKEKRMGLFMSPEEKQLKDRLESFGVIQMRIAELQKDFSNIGSGKSSGGRTSSAGSSSKSSPSSSKSSKSSTDPWLESFNRELANLQHNREMDLISAEEYYSTLLSLNNKYFKGREKYLSEYRKYEEEIYKGYDVLYDARLTLSRNYIEDRNFYNDWGADSEIEAWKRVKAYTEDYYRKGKISAEKYADEIRNINKSLYSVLRKEAEEAFKKQEELAKKAAETSIYGTIGQTEYERRHQQLIDGYEAEIDRLQKKADLEDEIAERKKRQLELEELRLKLSNTLKNRNTLMLVNGQYQWVADPEEVDRVNKEIAEKEKSNADWELETQRKHQISRLKSNIEYERDLIKNKKESFDKQISIIDESYKDIQSMTDEYFANLKDKYGLNNAALINEVQSFVNSINSAYAGLDTGSGSTGSKTVKAGSSGNAPKGTGVGDIVQTQGGTYKVVSSGTTGAKYNPSSGLWSVKIDDKKTYATGGVADYTGGAILHGSPSAVETIFNATQGKKLYDFINNVPNISEYIAKHLISTPSLNLLTNNGSPLAPNDNRIFINGLEVMGEKGRKLSECLRDVLPINNRGW